MSDTSAVPPPTPPQSPPEPPLPPHPTDFSMPQQVKPNMAAIYLTLVAMVLVIVAAAGYGVKRYLDQRVIDGWVRNTPVNAMILEKHPEAAQVFKEYFKPYYYEQGGKAGLEKGQLDMQQNININYLADYVWLVKDPEVREFVKREYFLVAALVKQAKGKPGLCEKYYFDSSLYKDVDASVGGNIFADYMKASEALMLSAKDKKAYFVKRGDGAFPEAKREANDVFWTKFRELHPGLSDNQLPRTPEHFNPRTSCARYAEYLRTMLQIDTKSLSIHWRSGQEVWQAEAAMRRQAAESIKVK